MKGKKEKLLFTECRSSNYYDLSYGMEKLCYKSEKSIKFIYNYTEDKSDYFSSET